MSKKQKGAVDLADILFEYFILDVSDIILQFLSISVEYVYSTNYAFAAKLHDGTVVTWGDSLFGGDSSVVQSRLVNVDTIYSTKFAFAAKLQNGTIVTWGDSECGGDSSAVQSRLVNVDTIYLDQLCLCGQIAGRNNCHLGVFKLWRRLERSAVPPRQCCYNILDRICICCQIA